MVLVRHGQSEANIAQQVFKTQADAVAPEGFSDRHDSHMRLSALGREQEQAAGAWRPLNRRSATNADLLAHVQRYPHLIADTPTG